MKSNEIRLARTALLEKSILGYRKAVDGSHRSERTSAAKVGNIKTEPPARLLKAAEAKVGLPKTWG